MKKTLLLLFLMTIAVGCNTIKRSAKTQFTEGFYKQSSQGKKEWVYVEIDTDTFRTYKATNKAVTDTIPQKEYPSEIKVKRNDETTFTQNTPDIDFITIPLKFRPGQGGVKPQLNATINGQVYLGYRTDRYIASYNSNPLNRSLLDVDHYGFSFGIFTGIGNTAMNATTTKNRIIEEYDGIVWSKGVAGIIAINNFTTGITLGFDTLLDGNDSKWIYQNKPWIGLALGLNLN